MLIELGSSNMKAPSEHDCVQNTATSEIAVSEPLSAENRRVSAVFWPRFVICEHQPVASAKRFLADTWFDLVCWLVFRVQQRHFAPMRFRWFSVGTCEETQP